MVKALIFTLFFISVSTYTMADIKLSQKIMFDEGVSISIPQDWVQVPKDAMERIRAKIAQVSRKGAQAFPDYGFQFNQSSAWLTCPYTLVKINDSGRIPESELSKLKNVKSFYQNDLKDIEKSYSKFINSASEGDVYYDSDNHIQWSYMTINNTNNGTIKAVTALILTEKGSVNVMEYAKVEDFNDFLPLFQDIVKHVDIPDDMKYVPRMTDSIPFISAINWRDVLHASIKGAIFGGIFGLVLTFFRRKK